MRSSSISISGSLAGWFQKVRACFSRCATALWIGAALIVPTTSANAQSTAEEAYKAYAAWFGKLGFEVSNDPVQYDGATDVLVVPNTEITLSGSFTLPPNIGEILQAIWSSNTAGKGTGTYHLTFNYGTITYEGFAHQGDRFSVKRVTCSRDTEINARVDIDGLGSGQVEQRIEGITVKNYSVTLSEPPPTGRLLSGLKAFFVHSYDLAVSGKQTGKMRVVIEREDGPVEIMSSDYTTNGTRITDVVDGKMGRYEMNDFKEVIRTPTGFGGGTLMEIRAQRQTVLLDLYLPALFALLDPSIPATGKKVRFIGSYSIKDQEVSTEDKDTLMLDALLKDETLLPIKPRNLADFRKDLATEVHIKDQTYTDIDVIKTDFDMSGFLARLSGNEKLRQYEFAAAIFQLARSFSFGNGTVTGLSLSEPSQQSGEGPVTWKRYEIRIGGLGFTNINSSGIGELRISGLDVPVHDDGHVRLGRLSVGDITFADFERMKPVLEVLFTGQMIKIPIQMSWVFGPRSLSIGVEDLDIDFPGETQLKIGKAELHFPKIAPPVPMDIDAKTENASVPVEALDNEEAIAFLTSIGLETITWSDETRAHWDENTLELTLEKLMIDVGGLGRAEAKMKFANVSGELFVDPVTNWQSALVSASFVGADIRFTDAGVTAKAVQTMAQDAGVTEEAFAQALVAQAEAALQPADDPAFSKTVTDAVADFLSNPGTLRVVLAPEQPVPVAQIVGGMVTPQVLPGLLNVQVTSTH